MRIVRTLTSSRMFSWTIVVLVGWFSASPTRTQGQTGYNAVWGTGTSPASSASFIDASVFSGDLCAKITAALNSIPAAGVPGGAVIDARGINPGTAQPCAHTPWNGTPSHPTSAGGWVPSHILLPSGTITISNTWILPDKTKITGDGNPIGGSGTTIQAASTWNGGGQVGAMIEMGGGYTTQTNGYFPCDDGGSNPVCYSIAIEDLKLDGANAGGTSVVTTGIYNNDAEELSYVNRVSLNRFSGDGLDIETTTSGLVNGANNSGPYSSINLASGSSTAICVKIAGARTRGIHGITCNSSGSAPSGIELDGSSNTIEDVHIEGFTDGIIVGDSAPAAGNVIVNVNAPQGVTNIIHISNANAVTDLSIHGVTNSGATNTIDDQVTGTTLTDAALGTYVLGRPMLTSTGTAISRFTTSPSAPAWGVGNGTVSGGCVRGSLYSNAQSVSANTTLFICTGNSDGSGQWAALAIP